jgi:hypothetical protein
MGFMRAWLRGGGADAEEVSDREVIAFGGEGERGFAVVGGGAGIGALREKEFDDFEMAVRGRGEERRVAGAVAIVGVEAAFEEPRDGFRAACSDGGGERVVARAVGGNGVDVRALFGEVAGDIEMAEETSQCENGEAIGREGFGEPRIGLDDLFDLREITRSGSFENVHRHAGGEQEIADFLAARVDREEQRRDAGFVAAGGERGIRGEERADLRKIAGADGIEEGFGVRHGGREG